MRMNFGTNHRRFRKVGVEHYPVDTMTLDLTKSEEELWAAMAAKTRYAIRLGGSRSAGAKEEGASGLGDFCLLYEETAKRNGLPPAKAGVFLHLFQCAARYGLTLRLYTVRDASGRATASAIFANCGSEAWYLFAASSACGRELNGPSRILWQAMRDLKRDGVAVLDLLGVGPAGCDDHPLSRLTHFKAGFGGARAKRLGAWDWVIDEKAYADMRGREMACLIRWQASGN
jgi:lipid II:glycine glycyltransferase (peptidoglycan interpeptide bridge formation enzyme)